MKKSKNLLERMTLAADLPSEPLPGVPLVEVAGDKRVLIEHHCGIIAYGCQQISVKVSYGHICICGTGLEMTRMSKEQLVINGKIESISLIRGRK